MSELIVEERFGGSGDRINRYRKGSDGRLHKLQDQEGRARRTENLIHWFKNVFLPAGYPESVSDDYLEYQLWDTLQAFASSIVGTLSAQAVLKGYGVGDSSATVLAATLTWLLKDGTGMLQ